MREQGKPRQIWPMIFGLSVFALAAIAIAAFMLASNRTDLVLISGAIFLLAVGQVTVILALSARTARSESHANMLGDVLRRLTEAATKTETRLTEAERLAKEPDRNGLDKLMAEVKGLRDSVRTLLDRSRRDDEKPSTIRWGEAQSSREPPPPPYPAPAPEAAKPSTDGQRLDLLLEPLIELTTGATAHYRALLDLASDNGQIVQHAELMEKANEGGMRPALDAHLLKQVVPVLRRLRNRNPGLRAFVPIGAATLDSREDLGRIASLLGQEGDVVRGLVFEITHRDLGLLDDDGIEGLARLARAGATLALAEVQVSGLDLGALKQLGVRFLSFPPSAAGAGFGPTSAWREFMQYARAMQFQIIIADVRSSQQANAASSVARYAHGTFYAPPRKVKADAGAAAPQYRSAAA